MLAHKSTALHAVDFLNLKDIVFSEIDDKRDHKAIFYGFDDGVDTLRFDAQKGNS